MEDILKDVTMDVLSDVGREIAEVIGMEPALKLFRNFSGECVYIPRIETIEVRIRTIHIQEEFNGTNTKELARRYGLGVRMVERIISEPYRRPKTRGQRNERRKKV